MGNISIITTAALAAMALAGFVFSMWYVHHDNLDVI